MIHYELISCSASLGVYCNYCNVCCHFTNHWHHDNVAFWTHKKEKILCPECATKNPNQVYRKVHRYNDIPDYRSGFKSYDKYNLMMFSNDTENKQIRKHYFCSKTDEEREFAENKKEDEKCKCEQCCSQF